MLRTENAATIVPISFRYQVSLHLFLFPTLADLAKTAFPIYIIEQREGDIVVLPPESVYQCFSAVSWLSFLFH